METYDLTKFLTPFWQGNTVYYETGMFYLEDGEITLLFTPDKVLSVTDYGLQKTYVLGKDYIVNGNKLIRTKNSSIPFATHDDLYATAPGKYNIGVERSRCPNYKEGYDYLAYGEQDTFTKFQIAVTYTHSGKFNGYIPEGKSDRFKGFNRKLADKNRIKMVVYGDSIATGCNASGSDPGGHVPPYCDIYPVMIQKHLERTHGVTIDNRNVAVGGWSTKTGIDNFDERVLAEPSDLMILAFGMNDLRTPPSEYKAMIEDMVLRYRKNNPTAEVVLVATMIPNPESTWLLNQPLFLNELLDLESRYDFLSVANVTTTHEDILKAGKRYRDITGNNINHPNDFIVRLYAQTVLKTLIG
ncbi:MAG: SGNH/GDSL hydrolase family protein [Clostridiales bacterium]|nr:SGNH/GDSL hydrolase family protein [Clostridiales bacterium]